MAIDPRVSVVVLTHNRAAELEQCLERLRQLPEQPHIIVVDNASTDGGAARLAPRFIGVDWVICPCNLGAAGRNHGVARVRSPFVAFCDDDTWWTPGALRRAADLLDHHPQLGAINARVLVGHDQHLDPTCERMAHSPLDGRGLPGPALLGFMAGAVVMRSSAYREVGGYEPRLFLGAEEALMALDLAVLGWRLVYAADVVCHHRPSAQRDVQGRQVLLARNRWWTAWLRLPWSSAWQASRAVWTDAAAEGVLLPALARAACGLAWVLRHRRRVPTDVHEMHQRVYGPPGRAELLAARKYLPSTALHKGVFNDASKRSPGRRHARQQHSLDRWDTSDF